MKVVSLQLARMVLLMDYLYILYALNDIAIISFVQVDVGDGHYVTVKVFRSLQNEVSLGM